jgi:alpha-mannosidase
MTALKVAEGGGGYILRCYESSGTGCRASFDLPFLNRSWQADFTACQIKTFFLPEDVKKPVREVNLLELPLED